MKPKSKSKTGARAKEPASSAAESAGSLSAGPSQTVLLAVTGMSPAIITETIWRLAHPPEGQERIIPDEVVLITTTKGNEDIERDLLNLQDGVVKPLPGWGEYSVWQTLRRAVLGPSATSDLRLQIPSRRIIELPDPSTGVKAPALDLRTPAQNVAAADFMLEEVRRFVGNPDTRVIASIAGGRKTMGALLYACMSLLGRETDRVTHVLVNSPFDDCRGFFFPKQPVQELTAGRDKQPVRASDARIDLADIPFVPLINRFRDLGEVPGGFMGLVRTISNWLKRDAMSAPEAVILFDRANCRVRVNALVCDIEGRNAFDVVRFVFEANEQGWVNDDNCRDFVMAAELFKASCGVKPDQSRISHKATRELAERIHHEFKGPPPDAWVNAIDSHKVSTALSALRSWLRKKHSQWKPPERSWRLPSFRVLND
ncbi:MAG: TIGR02584 family CRISPR-associated protein [Verrucomicrobia bacterium]|nr:TIGR02584 family CRISPR-associated protein [Verrucomicrobiota bacterium]